MRATVDMRVFELLTARLCHELISPVAAINNGVELLGEDDPDFVRDAVQLIGESGRRAGRRLQFYRFAYGTMGSAGGSSPEPGELVQGILEGGKITCDWSAEAKTLALEWQKLVANMVVLAAETLPRGGKIMVRPKRDGVVGVDVDAAGETVNVTPEMRTAISPQCVIDDLTSRTVHGYFTARFAEGVGARLTLGPAEPGHVVFTAAAG